MKRNLNRLANGTYDILIVGGGINGAALANMASLNGLEVALLEKGDFASGTSSKSTKLVHGGLRYLENFEFDLVRESLKERTIQLKNAPHLVKPLAFVIPVYKTDLRPLWMMKLGVRLYDFLSGKYLIERYRPLAVNDVLEFVPDLKKEDLVGGLMYYDAQMDDARLVLENILQADSQGAHVANYVEVKSLIKNASKTVGVMAYDRLQNKTFEVRAKKVVCCVGPWTNQFMEKEKSRAPTKVRTTKGIHIVYKGQLCKHALLFTTKKDRRIFFVIPWLGNSLIGTTDTDFVGNPDEVFTDNQDVNYLLKEISRFLPSVSFERGNIITTFAGLRPLVNEEGVPGKVSRKHFIEESFSGVVYVIGGKYTTYRKIAEDCLRFITKKSVVNTEERYPLYGGGQIEESSQRVAQTFQISEETARYVMDFYGTRYKDVLQLTLKNPKLKDPLCQFLPVIKAQVQYAIETEMACKPEDVLSRRLPLAYLTNALKDCEREIAAMFSSK